MDGIIGEIRMFAGNFAPRNWAYCSGQILPIMSYQALFSLLGTQYGGDGRSTFALPDLRGRVPQHPEPSQRPGQFGGNDQAFLDVQHLPNHTHFLMATSTAGTSNSPQGNVYGGSGGRDKEYADLTNVVPMHPMAIGAAGEGAPINIQQPFQVTNYIICLVGLYPSRS